MDWTQVLTMIGSNLAIIAIAIGLTFTMFSWARAEANQDRRDLLDRMDQSRNETNAILRGIQDEIKDFHGKLIAIEKTKLDK